MSSTKRARPIVLLVTPYLAGANNGNWRTASRWARMLASEYRVIVQAPQAALRNDAAAMIALHARRSFDAIAAWRAAHPDRALVVTLTGTDLYKDIPAGDRAATSSLALADRLVVLQGDAIAHLPEAMRGKARVVHQSARPLAPWTGKRNDRLHCLLVAHLREEKDPATLFAAWRLLDAPHATLTIIGAALDPALGRAARDLARDDARVRWQGPREHAWTRQAIKRAHLLIVPSRMEGGANVVVEAVTAGTAVAASRMSGNVGMLGDDYRGYFEVGDAAGLASLLARLHADHALLRALSAQCAKRAFLFRPEAEAASVRRVLVEAFRMAGQPYLERAR
ncbi:MAG: TIGR04348 family glycosyltransferase [Burkholderiales bacterium]|nr:TIGR04348 family glycosyltransferase [Burkholderiales bacterium]